MTRRKTRWTKRTRKTRGMVGRRSSVWSLPVRARKQTLSSCPLQVRRMTRRTTKMIWKAAQNGQQRTMMMTTRWEVSPDLTLAVGGCWPVASLPLHVFLFFFRMLRRRSRKPTTMIDVFPCNVLLNHFLFLHLWLFNVSQVGKQGDRFKKKKNNMVISK